MNLKVLLMLYTIISLVGRFIYYIVEMEIVEKGGFKLYLMLFPHIQILLLLTNSKLL